MPSTQIESNSNYEYRDLPITALVESSTNPRKRFDEKSVEELAASFKAQGVLAPLLVRELDDTKYEVVAGARRLRAARLAALRTVPVRVVKLSGAEAIEAQCTCAVFVFTKRGQSMNNRLLSNCSGVRPLFRIFSSCSKTNLSTSLFASSIC